MVGEYAGAASQVGGTLARGSGISLGEGLVIFAGLSSGFIAIMWWSTAPKMFL